MVAQHLQSPTRPHTENSSCAPMSNVFQPALTTLFRCKMPAQKRLLPKCGCRRRKPEALNSSEAACEAVPTEKYS